VLPAKKAAMDYFASVDGYRFYSQWVGDHYIVVMPFDDHGFIRLSEFGKLIVDIHTTASLDVVAKTVCTYVADYRTNDRDLTDAQWHQIAHAGIPNTPAVQKVVQVSLF
jgi:hypothetical protein